MSTNQLRLLNLHKAPFMKAALLESFVAAGMLLLLGPIPVHAQPLCCYADSIESTVANADLVVVGKLVEFADGAENDERSEHQVVIAIEEILKEDLFANDSHQRLRIPLPYSAATLSEWKDQSRRLLLAVNGDVPTATTVIDLTEGVAVLSADFTLLQLPEDVIRAARETVLRMPASVRRIHTFALKVPCESVTGTRWEQYYLTGGYLNLNVPVDERLETRSHESIRSDSYLQRVDGARALRYFKSDENIEQLMPLLDDPGWGYLHHPEQNNGLEIRHYGVRQEAYRTLKVWGVDVQEPMVREEIQH